MLFNSKDLPDARAPHLQNESPARRLALCSQDKARKLVPEQIAARLLILPLTVTVHAGEQWLYCAGDTRKRLELERQLQFVAECRVRIVPQKSEILCEAIPLAYALSGDKVLYAANTLNASTQFIKKREQKDLPPAVGEPARMVEELISFAKAHQASDLHLEPRAEGVFLSIRVQTNLLVRNTPLYSLGFHPLIVNRLKTLAALDTTKRSLPQDGTIEVLYGNKKDLARLSILPSLHGESVTLRFSATGALLCLQELGLDAALEKFLRVDLPHKTGLFLVAGSTGAGKTSTLYALMQHLAELNQRVLSVEDPVERRLELVLQTAANPQAGFTFEVALRAALRQDPDVLVIGEIRDIATAQIAARAAQTGHLVLSSIHAATIPQAIVRLGQLGVAENELNAALIGLSLQELVKKNDELCLQCEYKLF